MDQQSSDPECRVGTVVSSGDGTALVRVGKLSCGGCGISGACLASMDGGDDVVDARDPLGVSPGDRVEIGIAPASEVKIAWDTRPGRGTRVRDGGFGWAHEHWGIGLFPSPVSAGFPSGFHGPKVQSR